MASVLKKENIILDCKPAPKEEVIRRVGEIMVQQGFCTERYVEGMLEKEQVFNTYMGNQVALPHGIESVRDQVLNTGLVILVFPEAIEWGADEKVRLVIGIAAKGDDHIGVLSRIAIYCFEQENVDHIVESSADEIYQIFNSEEQA